MQDFPIKTIEIRYLTTHWGPYNFDFTDALPAGATISACTVKSYLGVIDRGATLSGETETTSAIIDTALCAVANNTTVNVFFKFPTGQSTYYSETGVAHTLVFEVTLLAGGQHPFYFQKVVAYA